MKFAYLLAFLDVRQPTPTVASVGIYSDHERAITIDRTKFQPVRITDAVRPTYEEARREVEQIVAREPSYGWVRTMLPRRAG